ncbi:HlyD family efflux transporter periplasmic adaptor subunit [Anaerotalea alkaliphila]|uniref:Membrane fusion protein n=1 Tax=Anaerotalea alkaliphila TaxID=2662126 RepID=A0A7X5HWH6_9FIRM|nr:HlyD family efflux transporter periplasmic adaptor subunit [Anaerotalea alkaliphila]NDL67940.1 hypothetical protein [Anaerotalea alkaliphila]
MRSKSKSNKYIQSHQLHQAKKEANNHIYLGGFVYFLIFSYLTFLGFQASQAEKSNHSLAEPGSILQEEMFTGMIIRNEVLVASQQEGALQYYVPEGEKVKKGSLVCAVDQDGQLQALLEKSVRENKSKITNSAEISDTNYQYLQAQIRNYVINSEDNPFEHLYAAVNSIDKAVQDISSMVVVADPAAFQSVLDTLKMYEERMRNNGTYYQAPKSGVVSYAVDGMEDVTRESFKPSDLVRQPTSISREERQVAQKDSVLFKIVDNGHWYVAARISQEGAAYLQDRRFVTMHFTQKNDKIIAEVDSLYQEEEYNYVIFKLDRQMNDFLMERRVPFKLIYNSYTGIKIPNAAVKEMQVFPVPRTAVFTDRASQQIEMQVTDPEAVGNVTLRQIPIKVYYRRDNSTFVAPINEGDVLRPGDTITYTDPTGASQTKLFHTLLSPEVVEGVFVLNKGFADFKRIETIYKESGYRIVDETTSYGVRIYDKIASDASAYKEFQVILE